MASIINELKGKIEGKGLKIVFPESNDERKEVSPYSVALLSDNVVKAVVRVYTAKRYNLYKEAEVKEIIFLHAVAKVERNKAKEKQKAAKEAPAPSIY